MSKTIGPSRLMEVLLILLTIRVHCRSGLLVADMVCESTIIYTSIHHKDTKSFEKNFRSRQVELIEAFINFGNLFSNPTKELINIILKRDNVI